MAAKSILGYSFWSLIFSELAKKEKRNSFSASCTNPNLGLQTVSKLWVTPQVWWITKNIRKVIVELETLQECNPTIKGLEHLFSMKNLQPLWLYSLEKKGSAGKAGLPLGLKGKGGTPLSLTSLCRVWRKLITAVCSSSLPRNQGLSNEASWI